jgi:hypothetical protein
MMMSQESPMSMAIPKLFRFGYGDASIISVLAGQHDSMTRSYKNFDALTSSWHVLIPEFMKVILS